MCELRHCVLHSKYNLAINMFVSVCHWCLRAGIVDNKQTGYESISYTYMLPHKHWRMEIVF